MTVDDDTDGSASVTFTWFINEDTPPGEPEVFDVSDLPFTAVANGWGPVEVDLSNGEQFPNDGVLMSIGGTTYPKGLGVHADSQIAVTLPDESTLQAAGAIARSAQIRDSLARAYEASGLDDKAIAELEWIVDHRGQGLVECLDECPALSSINWALAFKKLGRLY